MNEDAELLSRYAAEGSEAAFAELTGRYADLVYSAALRMMNGDVPSAQDVTQQVFTEVARQAKRLAAHPALVGWLYTTARLMALRMKRTDQRRQAREQEATTMNDNLHDDAPSADWSQLAPVIEDAMHELDEKDRHAVLLRYFQNKSLNEVGVALNLSENAARMRVDRAVDKLRGKLALRGITTSAAVLCAVIGTNAVQAAPCGFVASLSAAAIAGSAIHASTAVAATQTIVMTTLQKSIVVAALAVAAGTGIYAVRQDAARRGEIEALRQEQAPLSARVQQLQEERNKAAGQLAALQEENARLRTGQNPAELLKLRGQVGTLRQQAAVNEAKNVPASGLAKMMSDPAMKEFIQQAQKEKIRSMYADFFKEQKLSPEQTEAFLQVICDHASTALERLTSPAPNAPDPSVDLGNQLPSVLGEAGFERFKQYSEEIPARTTVALLKDQLGPDSLNDEQQTHLLQIVKGEPYNLTQGITGAPDQAFLGSQSDIDTFLQQVAQSNRRIVQKASAFLSTDQLAALDSMLSKAIETRKLQAAALIQKH